MAQVKKVTMDIGFCVTACILHLHDLCVFGQSLIKKRKYWPKGCPGDFIDEYMEGKPLGFVKIFLQDMDGIPFYIHCTRDDRFVTKLMSTHGLLTEVDDHKTYWQKDGAWVSFNYVEYLSRHNRIKHWVDDVNNRRHDPIGLEQVWHTKCWETRQFTFICSVAEANSVYSRAHARQGKPTPQLAFRRQLALKMLTNSIVDDDISICSYVASRKRRRIEISVGHELTVRPNFTGIWKTNDNTWVKVRTKYLKTKCLGCKIEVHTYCECNKKKTVCSECYAKHILGSSSLN